LGREASSRLPASRVVPLLVERLADADRRVREAAALALAQRGEAVAEVAPDVVPALIRALDDGSPTACGQAARLLVAMSGRLSPAERASAVAGVDRASRRFSGRSGCYVQFESMG